MRVGPVCQLMSTRPRANDGHDTRALQHYLGHKNIQHTVRYTEMAPDRFKDFWRN
jgi:type 1 fimbriae regulatory protein FimB/type 1 fimbriae regulatory protein FimE